MPKKLDTIILPPERWTEVEETERAAFRDAMPPSPAQSAFLAAVDDEIAAYLRVEVLHDLSPSVFHLVHVYEKPDRRDHAHLARQLMEEAARLVPKNFSGIWLTRRPYPQLAAMLGARELPNGPFHVYRRDN